MIAVDTNVLVRFLTGDDPDQSEAARHVVASATPQDPVFLSTIVLVETWWVLRRAYDVAADDIVATFTVLGDDPTCSVEHPTEVGDALHATRAGADFADALIARIATAAGCRQTLTFDRRAARTAGMTLLS